MVAGMMLSRTPSMSASLLLGQTKRKPRASPYFGRIRMNDEGGVSFVLFHPFLLFSRMCPLDRGPLKLPHSPQ